MTKEYTGWRFLYSPRWLGYYAMLVVFAVACVLLANWQFDRRDQARAEIARITNNYDRAAVPLHELAPDGTRFDEDAMKWHPVTLSGEYVGDWVLIRNRPGSGGVGSDLAQGFRTTDGDVLFVNRGWVAVQNDHDETNDLPLAPTGEPATIEVRLRAAEPNVAGRTSTEHTVGSFNVSEVAKVAGVQGTEAETSNVYTAMFGLLMTESPEFAHGELAARPEKDEGPHFSYALQWLVFILIAGFGIGYAARQEFRNFNRGTYKVRAQDERRRVRKERRGPSDADEEDAWIEDNT